MLIQAIIAGVLILALLLAIPVGIKRRRKQMRELNDMNTIAEGKFREYMESNTPDR